MYELTLAVHNLLRWIVLIAAVVAVSSAAAGWTGRRPWTAASAGPGRVLTITLDLQFLLGVALYGMLSPVTKAAFADFGAAMAQRELRFFAVEHALLMVLAIVAAHVGKVLAQKGATDVARYRRAAVWYGLSLLLLLAGMPWWRPLLRWG
ncbi:MAG TPA: hypothetical protein VFS08_13420 [Gemmatimonadaceae bacterium]|nr:hypothetical protein [Gemmatimonadaceae bacterium]